ncbi:MAG: lipid-binding SYLF domain-containing protein [Acidobacteriaceae bacterium]|jgi:lipid-binding SYLF domain-containing protein
MKIMPLFLVSAFALTSGNLWAASGRQDSIDRLQMSSEVLHSIMDAPDKGIPDEVVKNAKCIVVVPHLVKGGFVVGGEHGRGIASCRTADGWSAPAFVSVGGGSWGLQIGVEGVDLVMVVMNDHGLQHLLGDKFQLSGDASASAGPVGRHASAGTDWKMTTEVLTYSRSHGVFAGVTLDGAVVEQDVDSTRAIYGRDASFRSILSGRVPAPRSTLSFMRVVGEIGRAGTLAAANQGQQ